MLHDNFLLRLFKVFPEKQYFLYSYEDIISFFVSRKDTETGILFEIVALLLGSSLINSKTSVLEISSNEILSLPSFALSVYNLVHFQNLL